MEEQDKQDGDKRTFFVNKDNNPIYTQNHQESKSKLPLILIIGLIIVAVAAGGLYFRQRVTNLMTGETKPSPSPTAEAENLIPSPTPNLLVRSDWSFEVLNGSGEKGLAKKIADKLQDLGYPVIKVGNASKDFQGTEISVKQELFDKVDLVIADIRDVIKIATVSGELKEGTASARIILGKDSI